MLQCFFQLRPTTKPNGLVLLLESKLLSRLEFVYKFHTESKDIISSEVIDLKKAPGLCSECSFFLVLFSIDTLNNYIVGGGGNQYSFCKVQHCVVKPEICQ